MIAVLVVAVLALVGSIVANHYLRPRLVDEDEDKGMSVRDLVGPLQTLTILLLAFTLVSASASYGRAETAARGEAHALDHLAELAEYAPKEQTQRLQSDAICYARAVRTKEWPAMRDGSGSPAPSVWTRDFRHAFTELKGETTFGMLVAADSKRSEAREERLVQSSPSIADPIFWFLLVALALTIIALGLSLPTRNNRGQLTALVIITVLLTTTLVIIRDVDRPFGGFIDVPPTAIANVEQQITKDFKAANHKMADIPCDGSGIKAT
ncbi:bestrophin-like domain [Streptomyces sp. NPDC055239]